MPWNILISVEGPSLQNFDFNYAINIIWWKDFNTTCRPNQLKRKEYQSSQPNSACDIENEVSTTTTSLLLGEWGKWRYCFLIFNLNLQFFLANNS